MSGVALSEPIHVTHIQKHQLPHHQYHTCEMDTSFVKTNIIRTRIDDKHFYKIITAKKNHRIGNSPQYNMLDLLRSPHTPTLHKYIKYISLGFYVFICIHILCLLAIWCVQSNVDGNWKTYVTCSKLWWFFSACYCCWSCYFAVCTINSKTTLKTWTVERQWYDDMTDP